MDPPTQTLELGLTPHWGLKDIAIASLVALALMVIMGVALFVGLALWGLLSVSDPPTELMALSILGLELLMIPPAWFWGPRKYGGGWKALGFQGFPLLRSLGQMTLAFLAMVAINAGWEVLREQLGWAGQPDVLPVFGGGVRGLLLALLIGGVAAPLAEEVFFRGFLYTGLRNRWGVGWALVASGVIFALVHVIPGVLVPIFVMGVAFAFIFERTNSIWPCIILHGAINSLAFLLAYAQEVFPSLATGL